MERPGVRSRWLAGRIWERSSAVHLNSFSVSGFRSLTEVADIPVSKPTILAGHNDGGKSALLDALAFLLGVRSLSGDDRSYLATGAVDEDASPVRCESTSVCGTFTLDAFEQEHFDLPEQVQLRRHAGEDLVPRLQIWERLPDDERLHDLSQHLVPALKGLVAEFGLSPTSSLKADLVKALRVYGRKHASRSDWLPAPGGLDKRMPQFLSFDGKAARPDDAVKTALVGRFQSHMADPDLKGRLSAIEDNVKERLRIDAKSLCDHIRSRCPDLAEVFVEPDVSFQQGFRGAPLRIARIAGESVGLDRSGLGSNRRVSLAIWEWTSELLAEEESTAAPVADPPDGETPEPPPVQTIVVYDEPDTHLDYTHQRKIMQLIREQSAIPNVSVLVATHSMNLIDGVDISDVVHLKLDNHRTVVERLGAGLVSDAIDEHLGKIAASVGLRNSVLLHERCFLAVEGETEQRAFPLLFRLCEGLSLQAAGIALWACFNNEGDPAPGPLPRPARTHDHAGGRRRQPQREQRHLQNRQTHQVLRHRCLPLREIPRRAGPGRAGAGDVQRTGGNLHRRPVGTRRQQDLGQDRRHLGQRRLRRPARPGQVQRSGQRDAADPQPGRPRRQA
jgi:putative ATP-dependent endonuclease of the OLD family